ncbi:MAG TPA: enoyl-CoA hydratase-related protein [Candidatus Limnocylindrales bacterium]|nr:enoyl-CoA hydratase-related protein [Candidatus Limnocylindrales bacterium]HEX5040273.1 enoyl-CoA hydratase-related protein [Candidatus Limnocylindria bacterium]
MSGLRVERDGPFARVVLDRPETRNAFDADLIEALRSTFEGFTGEPPEALRGVVLAGDGPAFCAGADIDWMRASVGLSVEDNERDAATMQAMFAAIDTCPTPVIARVQGAALGGGMGLCAVADVVIAAAGTTFGFTETRLGILPAVISPFVLAKIGESHARALFPTGERFDAERAQRIGLVHEVVADEVALDARVAEVLDALRAAGPTAVRAAKATIRDLRELDPDRARRLTVERIARQRTSPEGQEGLTAFLEKRPPNWRT